MKRFGLVFCTALLLLSSCGTKNDNVSERSSHSLPQPVTAPEHYIGITAPEVYDTSPIVSAYLSGDRSGLDELQTAILDKASEVIGEVVSEGMSDYEKELAIHDHIIANCEYDSGALALIPDPGEHSSDPYGVLYDGKAICLGYTTTFRMFMDMVGIPCETVYSRDNEDDEHTWNIVTLDGAPYYVDITWDDPIYDVDTALLRHTYFNVSASFMREGHILSNSCPETEVFKDTFASHELYPEPIDDLDELLPLITKTAESGNSAVYFTASENAPWLGSVEIKGHSLKITDRELGKRLIELAKLADCYSKGLSVADTENGLVFCFSFQQGKS